MHQRMNNWGQTLYIYCSPNEKTSPLLDQISHPPFLGWPKKALHCCSAALAHNQTHGVILPSVDLGSPVGTDGERSQFASLLFLPLNLWYVVMKDLAKRRILQSFQFNLLKQICIIYSFVYELLKLVLLLPVAIARVERHFQL